MTRTNDITVPLSLCPCHLYDRRHATLTEREHSIKHPLSQLSTDSSFLPNDVSETPYVSRNKSFLEWHFVRVRRVTTILQDCRGQGLGIREQRDLLELKVGGLMRRDGWRAHEPRIPENSDGSDMDRYGK